MCVKELLLGLAGRRRRNEANCFLVFGEFSDSRKRFVTLKNGRS